MIDMNKNYEKLKKELNYKDILLNEYKKELDIDIKKNYEN